MNERGNETRASKKIHGQLTERISKGHSPDFGEALLAPWPPLWRHLGNIIRSCRVRTQMAMAVRLALLFATASAFSPTCHAPTSMGLRSAIKAKLSGTSEGIVGRGMGRGGLYDDITQTIGITPVVKMPDKLAPPGVTVYASCEFFNPLSSVKATDVASRRAASAV